QLRDCTCLVRFFVFILRPLSPLLSPLLPYTTLFRSWVPSVPPLQDASQDSNRTSCTITDQNQRRRTISAQNWSASMSCSVSRTSYCVQHRSRRRRNTNSMRKHSVR